MARHLEYQGLVQKDNDTLATVAKLRKEQQAVVRPDGIAPAKGTEKSEPAWFVARPDGGRPIFWTGAPGELRVEPAPREEPAAWWSRESLVLFAIAAFLLSWLPQGLPWFVRLWPEQLAGLAALGCLLWGISFVALVLVALAAAGRVLGLFAWLRRRMRADPSTLLAKNSSNQVVNS